LAGDALAALAHLAAGAVVVLGALGGLATTVDALLPGRAVAVLAALQTALVHAVLTFLAVLVLAANGVLGLLLALAPGDRQGPGEQREQRKTGRETHTTGTVFPRGLRVNGMRPGRSGVILRNLWPPFHGGCFAKLIHAALDPTGHRRRAQHFVL